MSDASDFHKRTENDCGVLMILNIFALTWEILGVQKGILGSWEVEKRRFIYIIK